MQDTVRKQGYRSDKKTQSFLLWTLEAGRKDRIFSFLYFKTEKVCAHPSASWGRGRERRRILSRLPTVSTKPSARLDLTNQVIRT